MPYTGILTITIDKNNNIDDFTCCYHLQKVNTPWLKMLTSPAVWAIIVANVTSDWGIYTMLTNIPTYMFEVLKFDMTSVSFSFYKTSNQSSLAFRCGDIRPSVSPSSLTNIPTYMFEVLKFDMTSVPSCFHHLILHLNIFSTEKARWCSLKDDRAECSIHYLFQELLMEHCSQVNLNLSIMIPTCKNQFKADLPCVKFDGNYISYSLLSAFPMLKSKTIFTTEQCLLLRTFLNRTKSNDI